MAIPNGGCRGAIEMPLTQFELETWLNRKVPSQFELAAGDSVALCTYSLAAGGAERQWAYLAQGLHSAGFRVTFITLESLLNGGGHYLPLLTGSGISLFDSSKLSTIEITRNLPHVVNLDRIVRSVKIEPVESLLQLTATLNILKPKVVFAQLDEPNLVAGVASRLCNIPRVVLSFRSYNPCRFGWFYKEWYLPCYQLLSQSPAVVFTGNSVAGNNDYADWIGMPRELVHLIPNVVDPEQFPTPDISEVERLRESLGIHFGQPVVLGVFRLRPEKDPETFVRVAGYITKDIPNLRVLLAGIGPMRARLEQLVVELGLSNNFQFLGSRSDVNVLMALADLVLLTSKIEGMPNVVLEAQLMGTPVVATRTEGIARVAIDGVTSLLCTVADVESLADACKALIRDKSAASKMGATGRTHVLQSFPKEKLAERMVRAVTNSVESL